METGIHKEQVMDIGKKVKITKIPDPVVAPVFPPVRVKEPELVPVRRK